MTTKISWVDLTLNPITYKERNEADKPIYRCIKKSPACKFCYAEKINIGGPNSYLKLGDGQPYQASYNGKPLTADDMKFNYEMVKKWRTTRSKKSAFVSSMTDWAAVNEFVKMDWAVEILDAAANSSMTFYLLTKRAKELKEIVKCWQLRHGVKKWPQNVWLGFTAENQEFFDKRWSAFIDEADGVLGIFPDVNVFVSYEPALGPLVLPNSFMDIVVNQRAAVGGRWLIAGGESGSNARPPDLWWFEEIKNQCLDSGVIFHFKQIGDAKDVRQYKKLGNGLLFGQSYKATPLKDGVKSESI